MVGLLFQLLEAPKLLQLTTTLSKGQQTFKKCRREPPAARAVIPN